MRLAGIGCAGQDWWRDKKCEESNVRQKHEGPVGAAHANGAGWCFTNYEIGNRSVRAWLALVLR